ncbi:sodium:proton antiporter [Aminithiophilus ramosus]|uniref:Sodium:proton antiporter n=2 Tax=Synergistales TaxID=649776 RepID=A0A9Q7AKY8_9BACT|nr:Na+/H+ antiporter NhaC family protein [Aminithiophilus ramosus]QTX33410.1 sodium:proton antiporter [Aminithiophilus ramosus]QVL36843.1 sodium:proton antiporter [Synergistota bacterium]
MILTNPVVLSVVVMIVLCLLHLNIILALIVSALVAGLAAGMPLGATMSTLIGGMGGNSETALSYILLGALAVAISQTGLASILSVRLAKVVGNRKAFLLLLLAGLGCFSQNLIPIHIAFIPILIPPLLALFNRLRQDRRAVACALTFSLKAPYIAIPAGFGLIFHGILADQMTANGMVVTRGDVWPFTWILGAGMALGLLLAIFVSYAKARDYEDRPVVGLEKVPAADAFEGRHWLTLAAVVVAFVIQLKTSSLPLGAVAALALMTATGTLKWRRLEEVMSGGMAIMGMIAVIMLVAAGYGSVIRETKAVDGLVESVVGLVGGSRFYGALLMLLVGLLVTMGIGTSFGTIPVLAAIYCPLALKLGFSTGATVCLLAAAAALGDAGSPASDSTLGPTSGLNADGQHDHIWDTCVPTFLHFNIPLILFAMIGALLLY